MFNPMNLRFGAISFSRVDKPVAVSAYYNTIIPQQEKVNSVYIESFFRCHHAIDLYNKIAIGSLLEKRRVHWSILENTFIALPPVKEQNKIGAIITLWNEAIEKMERLISAKEAVKKGFMQRLLTGKKRLQGFTKPWREYHLGELFKERSERANDHLPLLSITREEGVIPREDVGRKDTSTEDKSKYLRICPGDIGYNTMRMWQGVSALSAYEGIVSPAYTIATPKKGVDGEFMAYLFKLPKTIHLFYRHSQGLTSDTWNLKFHHFREIKVTVPDIDEQKAIAQLLPEFCT